MPAGSPLAYGGPSFRLADEPGDHGLGARQARLPDVLGDRRWIGLTTSTGVVVFRRRNHLIRQDLNQRSPLVCGTNRLLPQLVQSQLEELPDAQFRSLQAPQAVGGLVLATGGA